MARSGTLLQHLDGRARSASSGDVESIARLEQIRSVLEPAVGEGAAGAADATEVTGEWPGPLLRSAGLPGPGPPRLGLASSVPVLMVVGSPQACLGAGQKVMVYLEAV